MNPKTPVLLFDGECNLCDRSVSFVLEKEKAPTLHFASLQSKEAKALLRDSNIIDNLPDSIVLLENGKAYTRSSAALKVARHLKTPWNWGYILIFIPKFIRDPVYKWVASNRYKWFGKKETCSLPTKATKERFLDKYN